MASAARSAVSARKQPLPLKAKTVPFSSTPRSHDRQTVPIIPSSRSAPIWLLRLYSLQRRSGIVTLLLMVGMLTVYGWTVYSRQMWNQAYNKLVTLQRDERQLVTTNEVLKNKMALQAEQPSTNMMPSNPASAIFLRVPQHPSRTVQVANKQTNQPVTQLPLGY